MHIEDLWSCYDSAAWDAALNRYWDFVQPCNMALEKAMGGLDRSRLSAFDEGQWYRFLRDEYFRWKYTAPNRYASTTKLLRAYENEGRLGELDMIRKDLLRIAPSDIGEALETAVRIHGLGPSGASGLLALMYPQVFATFDQFVVKALRNVPDLPEASVLAGMKPEALTVKDGITLIQLMQRKALENNHLFATNCWTPRKIDQVLWTYGR